MSTPDDPATADLERSGITPEQARRAGMFLTADASELCPDFRRAPGIALPYFDPWDDWAPMTYERDGAPRPFLRVRYLSESDAAVSFTKGKSLRYAQPAASGVRAYFPMVDAFDWAEVLQDAAWPLLITEGEKKCLAAAVEGIPTIGLGGVDSWRTREGCLLPELDRITWDGRTVVIAFDSDAKAKAGIQRSEGRLALELGLRRGADVRLLRLPDAADGSKLGVDDYLVKFGRAAFLTRLTRAPRMRGLDTEVLKLNEEVAWVESEGLLFDFRRREFITKSNFTEGGEYSARKVMVPTAKGDTVKQVSVTKEWLTHPLARRYDSALFVPGGEVPDNALNLWEGWRPRDGDVDHFYRLHDHVFSETPREVADLVLNLITYKVQHPDRKPALALVLVGHKEGSGKSLYARILREMVAPYGFALSSKTLVEDYNGWAERGLICVIDEAQDMDVKKGLPALKRFISEKEQRLNEKYRVARQVDNYSMFILTSNELSIGGFSAEDRRMIVVKAPGAHPDPDFYDGPGGIVEWEENGGPKKLLGHLLRRDIGDWRPPSRAPMTSEKWMAHQEKLSPVEKLASDMKQASDHNFVLMWIEKSHRWARETATSPDPRQQRFAKEVMDARNSMPVRPFYTPEELTIMFPEIVMQMYGVGRGKAEQTTPGALSAQLRQAGIPYLTNKDDPRGFMFRGRLCQFLVVAQQGQWREPITQAEFDEYMAGFPSFGQLQAGIKNAS